MRKTEDGYVEPQKLIPENPSKWILVLKKTPEMKYPHDANTFKEKVIEAVNKMTKEQYKNITADHPMVSAISVLLYNEKGESEFAHISYNLLFPDYRVEVE